MKCRFCGKELVNKLIDLGVSPPSNAYLDVSDLNGKEQEYPLKVMVCSSCWLVQTEDFLGADKIFSKDYAYFSSYSSTWLDHSEAYVKMIIKRLLLNKKSNVVEIAANDGYLLQYFKKEKIPCYGVEPTHSTAESARKKGISIVENFFSLELATDLSNSRNNADLIIANNVLAHVPDINDFISGFSKLLKPTGIATFEFPHLLNLINKKQFDTIYHEHYSYLSLISLDVIFKSHGLVIFDVEELSTHGGSLRTYVQKIDSGSHQVSKSVQRIIKKERQSGMDKVSFYENFQLEAERIKQNFVDFLVKSKKEGFKVAAYGAAAKGNTIMNFSGVGNDLIHCIADRNKAKQGKYMPGSRIPIVNETELLDYKPDYVIIFPWNIKNEIIAQLSCIRDWNGTFVTIQPEIDFQ
ncbi:class I SAM-dependent methyltransferase [bacterium]|jgi:SAM-dependent methyltransferase|nr:class I SAM-dependent methyltransferase [bacterium]